MQSDAHVYNLLLILSVMNNQIVRHGNEDGCHMIIHRGWGSVGVWCNSEALEETRREEEELIFRQTFAETDSFPGGKGEQGFVSYDGFGIASKETFWPEGVWIPPNCGALHAGVQVGNDDGVLGEKIAFEGCVLQDAVKHAGGNHRAEPHDFHDHGFRVRHAGWRIKLILNLIY